MVYEEYIYIHAMYVTASGIYDRFFKLDYDRSLPTATTSPSLLTANKNASLTHSNEWDCWK